MSMTKEQMESAERLIRENLKNEYEAHDAIVKRAKELEEICVFAIAACKDASPFLADMLMAKAETVFDKKLMATTPFPSR